VQQVAEQAGYRSTSRWAEENKPQRNANPSGFAGPGLIFFNRLTRPTRTTATGRGREVIAAICAMRF